MVPKMWERPFWEGVSFYLDPWDCVRLRTASTHMDVPGKYGPHGELFFSILKKEPMVARELVNFGPCIYSSRNSESICLDWFAHDGWRECLSVEP